MDLSSLLLILTFILGPLLYWFLTRNYKTWENQKIPSLPNPIPGFGHMLPVIIVKEHMSLLANRAYNSTKASMIGLYFMRRPALVVRDPELVKCVLQTDFSSFRNNGISLVEKNDPIVGKNPFFATDPAVWKESRARSVSHHSGKKMLHLFTYFKNSASQLVAFVDRKVTENNNSYYECQLKEFFERYTGEIVANTAFGIDGQSYEDNPDPMSFTKVAKTLLTPTPINALKMALLFYMPGLASFLGLKFMQKRTEKFFQENLKLIMKQRKESNTKVNDYLQFVIDASPEDKPDQIICDLIIFYGDTYETSSLTLSYVFYQLSLHQEVQEKLRDHIASVTKDSGGEVTYESIKNMNYLEQVIFETMRIMPPAGFALKVCTEETTLTGSDGLTCRVQPGNVVFIPTRSLHKDSAYWPNPEVFDPDRFSSENQKDRNKYVFIPFGEGPRMCLGMRMGLTIVKLATAMLISKYSIERSSITITPLKELHGGFVTYYEGGLWAKFKKLTL